MRPEISLIGSQFVCPPFLGAGLYIFKNQE